MDYYEIVSHKYNGGEVEESGCCLICATAAVGCLCFNCKCTKCDRYNANEGRCEISLDNEYAWSEVSLIVKKILKTTENSVLVRTCDDRDLWFPLSICKIGKISISNNWRTLFNSEEKICVIAPNWLLIEKGYPDE